MSPPSPALRFAAEFNGQARGAIEIVYWFDSQGNVEGEAYFRKDDMCAPIRNGDFAHPWSNLQYRLIVPPRYTNQKQKPIVRLEVLQWLTVDSCEPRSCEK